MVSYLCEFWQMTYSVIS